MNLVLFLFAFGAQYAIGAIIDLFPTTAGGGYDPRGYQVGFGGVFSGAGGEVGGDKTPGGGGVVGRAARGFLWGECSGGSLSIERDLRSGGAS